MSWKLDKEPHCAAEMKTHLSRLWKDIITFNIKDLGHALVNVPVEFCRACPYTAGHVWFWSSVVGGVVMMGLVAWGIWG